MIAAAVAVAAVVATARFSEARGAALVASAAESSCKRGYRHAVISRRHMCLRHGQPCALRFEPQYHLYRFHCHTGRLGRMATFDLAVTIDELTAAEEEEGGT